jgi:hypothetical protein
MDLVPAGGHSVRLWAPACRPAKQNFGPDLTRLPPDRVPGRRAVRPPPPASARRGRLDHLYGWAKNHKARSTKRSVVAVSFQLRHAVQELGQEPDGSVRIEIEEPSRVYRAERPAGIPTDCFCAAERGTVRRWLGKNVT